MEQTTDLLRLRLKAWNERRKKAEKGGLEKFYRLKETFREMKDKQRQRL